MPGGCASRRLTINQFSDAIRKVSEKITISPFPMRLMRIVQKAMPMSARMSPAGARNPGRSLVLRRSTGSAAHDNAYVTSLETTMSLAFQAKFPASARIHTRVANAMMEM